MTTAAIDVQPERSAANRSRSGTGARAGARPAGTRPRSPATRSPSSGAGSSAAFDRAALARDLTAGLRALGLGDGAHEGQGAGTLAEAAPTEAASVQASPAQAALVERLLDYLALLAKWNATYNLTAIRDPGQMLVHHLLDSLAVVAPLAARLPRRAGAPAGRLVDVGSGAGLPGIVLALAWPGVRVLLVEPVGKKAAFLRQCQAELALTNIEVAAARVESLDVSTMWRAGSEPVADGDSDSRGDVGSRDDIGGRGDIGSHGDVGNIDDAGGRGDSNDVGSRCSPPCFPDLIVCRAFASLADYARAVAHLAGPYTTVAAMKGAEPTEEIDALPPRWSVSASLPLAVPGLDARRCLVLLSHAPLSAEYEAPSPHAGQ
ncbi:MAG: 16S rRNA (guanine(527)-N(7))-methyltransferase RsmG [Burkholderiales bacterium]|nr:16S rRNA (guanine(527)-N(7))-methyltransferase RsmG [Burkholderiales bacterium]